MNKILKIDGLLKVVTNYFKKKWLSIKSRSSSHLSEINLNIRALILSDQSSKMYAHTESARFFYPYKTDKASTGFFGIFTDCLLNQEIIEQASHYFNSRIKFGDFNLDHLASYLAQFIAENDSLSIENNSNAVMIVYIDDQFVQFSQIGNGTVYLLQNNKFVHLFNEEMVQKYDAVNEWKVNWEEGHYRFNSSFGLEIMHYHMKLSDHEKILICSKRLAPYLIDDEVEHILLDNSFTDIPKILLDLATKRSDEANRSILLIEHLS